MSPYFNNNNTFPTPSPDMQQDPSDYFRQKYTAVHQQLLHTQNLNARLTADLTYQQAIVEDLSKKLRILNARDAEITKRVAEELETYEKDKLSWYEREAQLLQEIERLKAKFEEGIKRLSGATTELLLSK